jgi:hypothetical protein
MNLGAAGYAATEWRPGLGDGAAAIPPSGRSGSEQLPVPEERQS